MSLSLQSIASLGHKYNMDAQETAERLASFFISLGCSKVFDINLARHLALVESYSEFKKIRQSDAKEKSPILSSICPGWICYAEKTNGDLIIPHLSKVRSPQQIMGALLKKIYCIKDGRNRNDMYHVTLMPCFDKKLESLRSDFKDEQDGSQDVDCVLTPIELEEILISEGVNLQDFDRRKLDICKETNCELDKPLTSHFGSASGGYAENLLVAEARDVLGDRCDESIRDNLQFSIVKNGDFIELELKLPTDLGDCEKQLSRFAVVNGFRNIQTIVQRLKRKALKYDYIEIMACPSGCINGGAQCRPDNGGDQISASESAQQLYLEVPKVDININPSMINDNIYSGLGITDSLEKDQLLYTEFHPIPKMQNLTVNW